MNDRYIDLKTELLLNNQDNDKVEEYKLLFDEYYSFLEINYNKEFKKLTNLELTLEREKVRLEKLIELIQKRIKEIAKLEKEHKKITKQNIKNDIKGLKELEVYQNRLACINLYLECLNQYNEINSKNNLLKEQLISKEEIDNGIYKEIRQNEKEIDTLYNKVLMPEIIAILYEFCIIDTYEIDKINKKMVFDNRKEIIIREEKIIEKEVPITIKEEKKEENVIPNIEQFGSVKPVTRLDEIKKTQEENPNIVLPSLGLNKNENEIKLDNQKYLNKNN